jgi:hypothetical protein
MTSVVVGNIHFPANERQNDMTQRGRKVRLRDGFTEEHHGCD